MKVLSLYILAINNTFTLFSTIVLDCIFGLSIHNWSIPFGIINELFNLDLSFSLSLYIDKSFFL